MTAVREVQQRVQGYVRSVQDRGPQSLVDDVTAFARRRPGLFLVAGLDHRLRSGPSGTVGESVASMTSTARDAAHAAKQRTTDSVEALETGTPTNTVDGDAPRRAPPPRG